MRIKIRWSMDAVRLSSQLSKCTRKALAWSAQEHWPRQLHHEEVKLLSEVGVSSLVARHWQYPTTLTAEAKQLRTNYQCWLHGMVMEAGHGD